ncbi:7860_t:CDS:1 [Acaulospora colombiana]|uniref:7860_t:CDS:1 n=1 Tax=Acaulospora colombiana TaxID=27376 RepID=A0ACA9KR43_9GLOM|nr:7860_t:CDS:1 [Acaulospora colombiana]
MLLKRTLFAAFIAFSLLALCLNATPLRRDVGDEAAVDLIKLDGTVTFIQRKKVVTIFGKFKQGFTENDPEKYFIQIGSGQLQSFAQLDIVIVAPGTASFSHTLFEDLDQIENKKLTVFHNKLPLASGTITPVR